MTGRFTPLPRYDLLPSMGQACLFPIATVHADGLFQHGLSAAGGANGFYTHIGAVDERYLSFRTMSIIAYYVHIDDIQLHALREQPALVWNINSDPSFAKAALFDIDKDYDILAWLISEKKRKEQVQQIASYRAINREIESGANYDKAEFQRVLAEERAKLGAQDEDTNAIQTDLALEAIEGRGTEAQRDPRLNFGIGNARHFQPDEVKRLSTVLDSVTEASLRKSFSRAEMAKFEVGGVGWLEEADAVLDEFLIPAFRKLQAFYSDAARLGHHVLVIYQ